MLWGTHIHKEYHCNGPIIIKQVACLNVEVPFQSFMLVRGYICLSQSHIHKAHDSSSGWLSLTYLPAQLSINLHVHCTYYHVMCHVSQWYFSLSLVVPSLTCLEIEKNLSQVLPTISSPSVILIILTRSHEMSFIFCGLRLPYILSVGTGEITGLFFLWSFCPTNTVDFESNNLNVIVLQTYLIYCIRL